MFFDVSSKLLNTILFLRNEPSTQGAWEVIVNEMKKIRDDNLSELVHFVPELTDVNARQRQDVMRGVTICLDVLSRAFEEPLNLLDDIENTGKLTPQNKGQILF